MCLYEPYAVHKPITNEFWFLEVNTIPGMTNESLVPQMIKKSGMTIKEVMAILIEDTLNS